MTTPRKFVDAARSMLGAKWRHRGRKPWAVDCMGLVMLAAEKAGQPFEDESGYGREPWEDRLRAGCRARCGDPIEEPELGAVALIQWSHGEPSHLAIIGDHPDGGFTLIHAHNIHGVCEIRLSGHYLKCIAEIYRPRWGA